MLAIDTLRAWGIVGEAVEWMVASLVLTLCVVATYSIERMLTKS